MLRWLIFVIVTCATLACEKDIHEARTVIPPADTLAHR
jgi:hypothetical protein